MRAFNYCKLIVTCCFVALMSSCAEEDEYRAYTVSGRWFGDLGMMVDGQPALGSDIEFIQEGYRATWGHGYETDYYRSYRGVVSVEHYFEWSIDYGIIYLRFDDPALDCNIRDYSVVARLFRGVFGRCVFIRLFLPAQLRPVLEQFRVLQRRVLFLPQGGSVGYGRRRSVAGRR